MSMPDLDNDAWLAGRRVLAAGSDIAVQTAVFVAVPVLAELSGLGNEMPVLLFWAVFPLLYSIPSVWVGFSPAQLLLGLAVTTLDGSRPGLKVRLIRASILKSPYICGLCFFAFGLAVPQAMEPLRGGAIGIVVGILISFFAAAQSIELCKPPYYDRWLNTTVTRRLKESKQRGFAVVTAESESS